MTAARTVDDVVTRGLCVGCGLCESLAGADRLKLSLNTRGFLRPKTLAPLDAATEQAVLAVCPGNVQRLDSGGVANNTIWGPLVGLYEGYSRDEEIRFKGSSGGVTTTLAWRLVQSGQAKAVLEISSDPARPMHAMTRVVTDRTDLVDGAGSWYGPAAPLHLLHAMLDAGEPFVVIGKPCDIAGVRNLARSDPRVDRLVVCTLSFLCAGLSSHAVAHNVIGAHGVTEADVKHFRFRGHGCPGPTHIETHDGRIFEQSYDDTWSSTLNQEIQFRCKICPDSTGEQADIVCADSWDNDDGYAHGEKDGRGLILARTERGLSILRAMELENAVHMWPIELEKLERMQGHHRYRKSVLAARLAGLWLMRQPVPHFHGLRLLRSALHGWRGLATNLIGTIKRIRRGANRETTTNWTGPA
jgi:coenzyme F420 hydrogenase subunit beta